SVPTQERQPGISWVLELTAVGLGAKSAGNQNAKNWAQKSLSTTRATVNNAGETQRSSIEGRHAGQRFPGIALLGSA
ncbi:EamA family transporter, partial [Pseudomonas syringae pv. tagetis]